MSERDLRRTFYRLIDDVVEEPYFIPCSSRHEECYFKPPEFFIPPPPIPPWISTNDEHQSNDDDDNCDPNNNYQIQTCDNSVLVDSTSRLQHDDTLQNVLVILVCSILLVVIVLSVAIVIWRRRKRFLRSLMNEEHKSGEDEDHPKLPPSNDIELHENPDGNKHVFSNPNYPQQTINIGGLPFYLLPATKDSNVDECEGSYVSSSVLTVGPIYEDIVENKTPEVLYYNSPIQPSSEQTPPPPLPSGPRGRSNMNISNASPNLPPDSAGPSSHCTTSSSEVSIDSNSSPIKHVVLNPTSGAHHHPHHHPSRPFSTPRTPPARTGGVYYYSDTLRNNHKNGRNPQECESDSGISNSRTSTEEGTPPSRHALRGSGRKHPPPLPPTRRAVDTEVSVKPHKGSVQV